MESSTDLIKFEDENQEEQKPNSLLEESVIQRISNPTPCASSSSPQGDPAVPDQREKHLTPQLAPTVPTSKRWKHVTEAQLMAMSIEQIRQLRTRLTSVVEEVSSELVRLLQERQSLQEEVDIRNIAIEQLWKVQEKMQWRLTEPQLGIQMGVIFPSDNPETIDCS